MQSKTLSSDYWDNLYKNNETGWDIGYSAPALKEYIDQFPGKSIAILIPGCGNAYEAEYLLAQGFTNVTLIDIVPSLTAELEKKFVNELGKRIHIVTGDFFKHEAKYDLILEQTFLSALHPSLRPQYVDKMHALLVKGGHLAGVLFSKAFDEEGPPFGGTAQEYTTMFENKFLIKTIAPCYNSIERRNGNEVFINLIAK
jgi:methyl halide transferase